jgi:hypothetical protein
LTLFNEYGEMSTFLPPSQPPVFATRYRIAQYRSSNKQSLADPISPSRLLSEYPCSVFALINMISPSIPLLSMSIGLPFELRATHC